MNRVWIHTKASRRLFLAIPIPVNWSDTFQHAQERIQSDHVTGTVSTRWTERTNFHITVRFIGSVNTRCIPGLVDSIRSFLQTTIQFALPFESVHVATSDDPKMIWATFQTTKLFQQLVARSTDRIAEFLLKECDGMVMHNGHDVIPHVTIARLNGGIPTHNTWRPLMEFPSTLQVDRLVLYESKTFPTGSVYHTIATFSLKARV